MADQQKVKVVTMCGATCVATHIVDDTIYNAKAQAVDALAMLRKTMSPEYRHRLHQIEFYTVVDDHWVEAVEHRVRVLPPAEANETVIEAIQSVSDRISAILTDAMSMPQYDVICAIGAENARLRLLLEKLKQGS